MKYQVDLVNSTYLIYVIKFLDRRNIDRCRCDL